MWLVADSARQALGDAPGMAETEHRDGLEQQRRTGNDMCVLVAYASKYGSTRGVAERVAAGLREQGNRAELRPAQVADASAYDAVVFGSPVFNTGCPKERSSCTVTSKRSPLGRCGCSALGRSATASASSGQ
jgi:Flavodoxin domain